MGDCGRGDALITWQLARFAGVPVLDRHERIGRAIITCSPTVRGVPPALVFRNIGVSLLMLVAALWALRQNGVAAAGSCAARAFVPIWAPWRLGGKDARFFAFSPLYCTLCSCALRRHGYREVLCYLTGICLDCLPACRAGGLY